MSTTRGCGRSGVEERGGGTAHRVWDSTSARGRGCGAGSPRTSAGPDRVGADVGLGPGRTPDEAQAVGQARVRRCEPPRQARGRRVSATTTSWPASMTGGRSISQPRDAGRTGRSRPAGTQARRSPAGGPGGARGRARPAATRRQEAVTGAVHRGVVLRTRERPLAGAVTGPGPARPRRRMQRCATLPPDPGGVCRAVTSA